MKTNIITKISTGLLAAIITLGALLSERSVHADEVKARHTAVQATAPESPTRYTPLQAKTQETPIRHTAPETPTRYTALRAKTPETPIRYTLLQAKAPESPLCRDHTAAVREIDLRVSLDLYEQILTELEAARLRLVVGPKKKSLSEQQIAEWREALQIKVSSLAQLCAEYRKNIELLSIEGEPLSTAAEVK